jgi:O-methyltransferase/methyltransferase family protein
MSEQSAPPEPPPQARLAQMATGFILSRLVYTAASLGIADYLASGPKSAGELASPTGCDAVSLTRFMRTLTNFGILVMSDDGRFSLTPLGEPLRSDASGSVRSSILSMAGQFSWQVWEAFPSTVKTGKPAVETVFGMPVFDWLAQHPDEAKRFSETMVTVHGAEPPAIATAYDFSSCGLIVDVGGASGNLLAHVLAKHPRSKGVLFDLPQAMTDAPARLQAFGVRDRVTIQPGNAFDAVPPGADAYLLSHVIHDWNEDGCLTILRNCRAAMTANSRLLIIELVLREGNAPGFGSSDMVMMTLTGGAERTALEFESLLARAGLRMSRVIPTTTSASIVEAQLA